jgi:hypothetical protein
VVVYVSGLQLGRATICYPACFVVSILFPFNEHLVPLDLTQTTHQPLLRSPVCNGIQSSPPAKIQLEIFVHLSLCDLKAVQYAPKELRANAAVVGARYHTLDTFQRIAKYATLSRYVRELIFDDSVYDGCLAGHGRFCLVYSAASAVTQAGSSLDSYANLMISPQFYLIDMC